MDIQKMTMEEIRECIKNKSITAVDIVEKLFQRIEKVEEQVQAYLTLDKEKAITQAKCIDDKIAKGEAIGKLAGIPIAIKDNICTDGLRTTCASKMLEDFIPPYDATVIKKLKRADAIIIGKTNMDEFAMGSSTENSAFKDTKNPWDLTRVPGGSSGGSAAAVGAGIAPVALGSDTGGSIRQPAAFCGVVGLKPTYGLVSRFGLIAFASSLDQIGPITKTVRESALTLEVIQGNDPFDSTSVQHKVRDNYLEGINEGIKGLKIGIPKEYFQKGLDPEIAKAMENSIASLKSLGAGVDEISLPITDEGLAAYYIISSAEASSNLARFDGVRYGYRREHYENLEELMESSRTDAFGTEVKRRIMLGTYALSSGYYDAYYNRAQKLRRKIREQYKTIFSDYDLIISPTSPILPFVCGEKISNPLEMYLADIYTINMNLSELPGLSLPCGFSKKGLPIGLQFVGPHFEEAKIFKAAYALEQDLGIANRIPDIKEGA
jgi:aspartyl-tRNA(Asn)/glutamyl-tRNA(Gln) amidotransferase subunit A